jgi:hypothetical protein
MLSAAEAKERPVQERLLNIGEEGGGSCHAPILVLSKKFPIGTE